MATTNQPNVGDLPPVTYGPREPRLRRPPFWLLAAFLIIVVATWIPLVFFAKARVSTSESPRVQFFQDMYDQPRYNPQDPSQLFADGRAMRPPLEGTVARGQVRGDDAYYRGFQRTSTADGKINVTFFQDWPKQVQITPELLARGQERFNIYCAPCHGQDGYGKGPVHVRAAELQEPKWVPPTSIHDPAVRERPLGHLYNTVNVGIRNMPGYGSQIEAHDRWAIVAYVRALQLSQHAPASVVSGEQLDRLPQQQ